MWICGFLVCSVDCISLLFRFTLIICAVSGLASVPLQLCSCVLLISLPVVVVLFSFFLILFIYLFLEIWDSEHRRFCMLIQCPNAMVSWGWRQKLRTKSGWLEHYCHLTRSVLMGNWIRKWGHEQNLGTLTWDMGVLTSRINAQSLCSFLNFLTSDTTSVLGSSLLCHGPVFSLCVRRH